MSLENPETEQELYIHSILESRKELRSMYLSTLNYVEQLNEKVQSIQPLLGRQQTTPNYINKLSEMEKVRVSKINLQLEPEWLPNVNISSFMHVEYVIMTKLQHVITFKEVFSNEFLSLLLLINSSVFFLIATENRFGFGVIGF